MAARGAISAAKPARRAIGSLGSARDQVAKWTFPRLDVGSDVAKPSIKSLHLDELTQHISAQGAPSYRAKQITDWLYEKRVASFAEMTDLPAATRAQLAKDFSLNQPE